MRLPIRMPAAGHRRVATLSCLAAGVIVLACAVHAGQQSDQAFEVASIKPSGNADFVGGVRLRTEPGGRLVGTAVTAQQLIAMAYGVDRNDVVGLPSWAREDTFDVIAKAARPSTNAEYRAMMEQLLHDRFQFRGHEDSREQSVYRLVFVKAGTLGPQLHLSSDVCTPIATRPVPPPSFNPNSPLKCVMRSRPGEIRAAGTALSLLVGLLRGEVDRPLIDGTGLTGLYDFELRWRPSSRGPRQDDSPSDESVSLEIALREQLGLKLDSQRAPGRVVVVDRIERPSPD